MNMLKKIYQKALMRLASGVVCHFQPQRKFSFPSKVTLIPVIDINVGFFLPYDNRNYMSPLSLSQTSSRLRAE